MILCQNCLHKEIMGALFCSECGAQLVYDDGVSTSSIQSESQTTQELDQQAKERASAAVSAFMDTNSVKLGLLSLNLIANGEILSLGNRKEVTLGRVNQGQPIVPDIDLAPYKAYEAGVSRMHVSIKIQDDRAVVTDLGSANGTRVNGNKIAPHIPHPIKNGDLLVLGKFKIQILFNAASHGE